MKTLVVLLLVAATNAKVFERCEWARTLKNAGMDGYGGISLGNWVCVTKYVSQFNTGTTTRYTDGSKSYGIFQINSRLWCDNGSPTENRCGIWCSSLLYDNPAVAIKCAKHIVTDPKGRDTWLGAKNHCRFQDVSSYIAGCGL